MVAFLLFVGLFAQLVGCLVWLAFVVFMFFCSVLFAGCCLDAVSF